MTRDVELAAAGEITHHHVRRQQHERQVGQSRLLADALGHRQPAEVRHPGVEQHEAERAAGDPRILESVEDRASIGHDRRNDPPPGQGRFEQPAVGGVVVGRQHGQPSQRLR